MDARIILRSIQNMENVSHEAKELINSFFSQELASDRIRAAIKIDGEFISSRDVEGLLMEYDKAITLIRKIQAQPDVHVSRHIKNEIIQEMSSWNS